MQETSKTELRETLHWWDSTKSQTIFSKDGVIKDGISIFWNDEELSIEPYQRKQKHYYCGRELLRFTEGKSVVYQILSIDYSECCFARVYTDGEIEVVFKDTALIDKKHRKGGQSAHRYAQNRDNQITEWFRDVNERLKAIEGQFYVGISSIYYQRFLDNLSTYNQAKIIERRSCEYSGLTGVYQMVSAFEQEKGNKKI